MSHLITAIAVVLFVAIVWVLVIVALAVAISTIPDILPGSVADPPDHLDPDEDIDEEDAEQFD